MCRWSEARLAVGVVVGLTAVAAAAEVAASRPTERGVSLAEQAGDAASQKLCDVILTLPVVCDGVSQSLCSCLALVPQAEVELRRAIAAERRLGTERQVHYGVVAVDASIPAARLDDLLQKVLADVPGDQGGRRVRLSASVEPTITATGLAVDDGEPRDGHPGWRHCTSRDIILTLRAAEHDLRQHVLACMYRMVLANQQTVGQVARLRPDFDRALRNQLERVAGGEPVLDPAGVCVLNCTISREQLASLIGRALREEETRGRGEKDPGEMAGELRPVVSAETITVEGFSVPPPRGEPEPARLPRGPRPDWADRVLSKSASAAGAVNTSDPVIRRELAIKAAGIEARRQLWMEVEDLVLPDGRKVSEVIAGSAEKARLAAAIDEAIFTMSAPQVDEKGVATVKLGVRLEQVWRIAGERQGVGTGE